MKNLSFEEDFTKEEIIESLHEIRHPFEIAIFESKNPFNVGGCIRSHHNFLGAGIHLINVGFWYKKGAVSTLKYERPYIKNYASSEDFIEKNKDRNIVSFERREDLDTKDIRSFQYPDNPILLFGCENTGVPNNILAISKNVVSIPVFATCLDYNLCSAANIAMYDFMTKYTMRK